MPTMTTLVDGTIPVASDFNGNFTNLNNAIGSSTVITTYATGDIVYASATATLSRLAINAVAGLILKSTGTIVEWGPLSIDRSVATQTIVNDGAATTIYSFSVPANTLGTSRKLRLALLCDYLQNATGTTVVSSLYGSTSLGSVTLAPANDAGRRLVTIECELAANNSATVQVSNFHVLLGGVASAGTPGTVGTAGGDVWGMHNAMAENSATALTFSVTVDHSAADANLSFRRFTAHLTLI